MLKSSYPNNNCGECPIWLAMDESEGISKNEAIKKYCEECERFLEDAYDCDGRCLNCDEYHETRGCMRDV